MTHWIDRETAAEWPPQWPDSAVVQVEFDDGYQKVGPMRYRRGVTAIPFWWWWSLITRARRLDRPKPAVKTLGARIKRRETGDMKRETVIVVPTEKERHRVRATQRNDRIEVIAVSQGPAVLLSLGCVRTFIVHPDVDVYRDFCGEGLLIDVLIKRTAIHADGEVIRL